MNERSIFLTAIEIDDAQKRAAYLRDACGNDAGLRQDVEELLAADAGVGSFMESPAVTIGASETDTTPGGDVSLEFLSPSDQPGSLGRLGNYEITRVIGRGGMGIVLEGRDTRLERVVAVKVLAPQLAVAAAARQRFLREAKAAAAVRDEHVVTIYAVEEANGIPYLVMERIAGLSLQERIDRDGPLELKEVLRIGIQTARGLAAAHAHGLIHRDVKPANILLENGVERVKLTDFGLARVVDDASLTQSGVIAGTPQYMSPEQARGEVVDTRADLFGLGSVLYAMCTGRPPFRASTTLGVLKRVCEDAIGPIREANPNIPEWLVALIEKLHAKDPAGRYQSAAEVADVLSQHLAQLQHPGLAEPAERKSPQSAIRNPKSQIRHRRWALAAAAAIVLLLVGLGLSEAGGVTHLAATVIRIFTPQGTLVVETDDAGVKVTVEGDGGLVITGAGLEEIRLRPGSYRVHADKDGQPVPLDKDLVTVSRGGREIVKVKIEAASAIAAANTEKGAFVVLGNKGVAVQKFDTLAEAMRVAVDGDTIELRGDGPFLTAPILTRQRVVIRAAGGFRPLIRFQSDWTQAGSRLITADDLTLEGLTFESGSAIPEPCIIVMADRLQAANCRFDLPGGSMVLWSGSAGTRCWLKNCELIGTDGVAGHQARGGEWRLDNCVQVAATALARHLNEALVDATGRITKSTLVDDSAAVEICPGTFATEGPRLMRFQTRRCLFATGSFFKIADWYLSEQARRATVDERETFARDRVEFAGEANVFGLRPTGGEVGFLRCGSPTDREGVTRLETLDAWRTYSGAGEKGSVEGQVRFSGGDLLAKWEQNPRSLTPEDFRLRPDSAGYRAGPDGKDLGAEIDLVGPGPAYKRWKKTPEYQQWLKETGQEKQ